ncbi:hypothetical protein FHT44_006316 [Mycolicibacterium sp. BK634]|nr:hypothetical protein [Mycolicibacterium sp. BK634]
MVSSAVRQLLSFSLRPLARGGGHMLPSLWDV